ncbi:diguanylate phosphodiesterase [Shewanella sp. MR-4]|uniref:EAL domain-containing protein n=1 Tax=Shewanella sp. (strain MR-4) TaxID=60480 RepID=UPI0000DE1C77|nr:EAL domain-containing protein [Shewanella sp. MR-4]ABI39313.1 diguanylate phosphodiesterase [Shewanella sp. MR-4]
MIYTSTVSHCKYKQCIFHSVECDKSNCRHYYIYQNIIDRNGGLHAIEILSRPISNIKISIEKYFDILSQDEGTKILKHQLLNFSKNFKKLDIGTKKIFLNVDKHLLNNQKNVDLLINSSTDFNQNFWEIVFEITERQYGKIPGIRNAFCQMILNDVLFAADDYSSITNTHNFLIDYTYIKIDMHEIIERTNRDFNDFIDELYLMKECGKKLIVEKIQTQNDYLLTIAMPFDYFQGFYFDD